MRRFILLVVIAALIAVASDSRAQLMSTGIGPGDQGGAGGGNAPSLGCTNQLVLVYSNSCALIGQAWGQ